MGRSTVAKRYRKATLLLGIGFVVALSTCVSPRAKTMQQKLTIACAADVARLCPETHANPDDIKKCLLGRRAQVSEDCMRLIDASE